MPFSSSKEKQVLNFLSSLAVITQTQNDDGGELLCCKKSARILGKTLVAHNTKTVLINLSLKVD